MDFKFFWVSMAIGHELWINPKWRITVIADIRVDVSTAIELILGESRSFYI